MAWYRPDRHADNMALQLNGVNTHEDAQGPGGSLAEGMTALSLLQQVSDEDSGRSSVWMFSYIDLLTLLLSLFVILLAFQQKDHELAEPPAVIPEVQSVATQQATTLNPTRSLKRIISSSEVADLSFPSLQPKAVAATEQSIDPTDIGSIEEIKELPILPELQVQASPSVANIETVEIDITEIASEPATDTDIAPKSLTEDGVEAAPEATPQITQLDERIKTTRQSDKVLLEVRDSILFAPARIQLKQDGMKILDQLAELFKQHQGSIAIQGHTDDRPINNTEFASNWELSSARASRVARYLIDRGVIAGLLQVIGFADTKPLASNVTTEGRAQNRRVSFVMYTPDQIPVMP